jgi:hypothetical protein
MGVFDYLSSDNDILCRHESTNKKSVYATKVDEDAGQRASTVLTFSLSATM